MVQSFYILGTINCILSYISVIINYCLHLINIVNIFKRISESPQLDNENRKAGF
jgi:hypothetical protein